MCDKCNDSHKHYVCECGREFEKLRQMTGHQSNCKVHQKLLEEEREKRRLPNGLFKCQNPRCSNEHDGSYGSGLFCSEHCKHVYTGIASSKTAIKLGHKHCPDKFRRAKSPHGRWKWIGFDLGECEPLLWLARSSEFNVQNKVHNCHTQRTRLRPRNSNGVVGGKRVVDQCDFAIYGGYW